MTHSFYRRLGLGLERVNIATFVALFVTAKLLVSYIFARLAFVISDNPITHGFPDLGNDYVAFVTIVLIGPLIETFLFQYIFFKNLDGNLGHTKIVLLSALIFSLFHLYNLSSFLYAFFSGSLLSISYACRIRSSPFACTFLIHAFYNLAAFVVNHWKY
jgi:membrane protease YdiL (CAAX protease family)